MSTHEILAELPHLSAEDLGLISELARSLQEAKQAVVSPAVYEPRVAGLHKGAWIVAEDFDDPLPDEFWLGEDA